MPRPSGKQRVRPDRFRDQHAAPHALEETGADQHRAACIAQAHPVAVRDLERARVRRMDHHLGAALLRERRRRLVEGRVEELPRRAGRQGGTGARPWPPRSPASGPGAPASSATGPRRPRSGLCTFVQSGLNRNFCPDRRSRRDSAPLGTAAARRGTCLASRSSRVPQPESRRVQSMISRGLMREAADAPPRRASPGAQTTSWFERHSPGGSTSFGPSMHVLVPAALVEVVVLHEHRRRQDDVGHHGRLGHELLVHADEEVLAGKAPLHELLLRRDRDRIGVLDEHRGHRRAVQQRLGIAGEHAPDLRLVELAARRGRSTSRPSIRVLRQW